MDEQVIIDDILEKVSIDKVNFYSISLISSSEKLKKNIEKDIKRNLRETAGIDDSLARLKKYNSVDSFKVDISNMNIEETSKKIQFQ